MATATAHSYQAIGSSPAAAPPPAAAKAAPLAPPAPHNPGTPAAPAPAAAGGGGGGGGESAPRALLRAAGAALSAPVRELHLYLEPVDPAAPIAPRDRLQLALESCRPWAEFADVRALRAPQHIADVKPRVLANLESFFYNYLVLTAAFLVGVGLFHLGPLFLLVATLVLAHVLLVARPEPIPVGNNLAVTTPFKIAIIAVFALFALTTGHVFFLLLSALVFGVVLFAVHGIFHNNTSTTAAV